MYAALGVTLKPVPLSYLEPVIMMTLLPPTGAVGETAMVAVAVVGLMIVRFDTRDAGAENQLRLYPAPSW